MKELEYPFDSGYLLKKETLYKKTAPVRRQCAYKEKNSRSRRLNHERYN